MYSMSTEASRRSSSFTVSTGQEEVKLTKKPRLLNCSRSTKRISADVESRSAATSAMRRALSAMSPRMK